MSRIELASPIQTSRIEDYDAVVEKLGRWPDLTPVAVEKTPKLIEGIVVNPVAVEMLSPDFCYLASEDYLRRAVCLSVPMKTQGVLSPEYWGRAVPLGYGEIPYGPYVGGTLMGKGGFRSGKYYDRILDEESHVDMPIGFFGVKDSAKEMEIGNALHDIEFRSSLVLGYAVLNPKKAKDFLLNHWRGYPGIVKDIEKCFALLQIAREKPSFLIRIAGVTSRIHVTRPSHLYRWTEIVRATELLAEEAKEKRDHFDRYLDGFDFPTTIEILNKMKSRQKLSFFEFQVFTRLYRGIYDRNQEALELAKNHPILRKYQALGATLGAPKDNDPMLLALDFEEINEGDVYGPEWGYWNFKKHLAFWLQGEVGPGFVAEYNQEEITRLVNRVFEIKDK